jgi:hypothetical protein
MVMKRLFMFRQKSMVWTDKRAKLLQELLGGMKIIKLFNWQSPFLARIGGYRQKEMAHEPPNIHLDDTNQSAGTSALYSC